MFNGFFCISLFFSLAILLDELKDHKDLLLVEEDLYVKDGLYHELNRFMEANLFHLSYCSNVPWFLKVDQNVFVNPVDLYR